jgi:hypothetical protein
MVSKVPLPAMYRVALMYGIVRTSWVTVGLPADLRRNESMPSSAKIHLKERFGSNLLGSISVTDRVSAIISPV